MHLHTNVLPAQRLCKCYKIQGIGYEEYWNAMGLAMRCCVVHTQIGKRVNSSHALRWNVNIVTMPVCDMLLCHFRIRNSTAQLFSRKLFPSESCYVVGKILSCIRNIWSPICGKDMHG